MKATAPRSSAEQSTKPARVTAAMPFATKAVTMRLGAGGTYEKKRVCTGKWYPQLMLSPSATAMLRSRAATCSQVARTCAGAAPP
jgi:hypothetical protein